MRPEEHHRLLRDAICGCLFRSYAFAEWATENGLADFTGNQWNEEWAWNRTALCGKTIEELTSIYERARQQ